MEKSYYTYWVPFTPKDCVLKYFKCSKCGSEVNNPYPYCPWCGRPIEGVKDKEEVVNWWEIDTLVEYGHSLRGKNENL